MAYQIITLKAGAEDIAEVYSYYEGLQTGLGDRFLEEVLQVYNKISNHPQYYGFIDDQHVIRDVMIRSFPYQVVYEMKNDQVIVYSVHCGHRNPDKRFRKL